MDNNHSERFAYALLIFLVVILSIIAALVFPPAHAQAEEKPGVVQICEDLFDLFDVTDYDGDGTPDTSGYYDIEHHLCAVTYYDPKEDTHTYLALVWLDDESLQYVIRDFIRAKVRMQRWYSEQENNEQTSGKLAGYAWPDCC